MCTWRPRLLHVTWHWAQFITDLEFGVARLFVLKTKVGHEVNKATPLSGHLCSWDAKSRSHFLSFSKVNPGVTSFGSWCKVWRLDISALCVHARFYFQSTCDNPQGESTPRVVALQLTGSHKKSQETRSQRIHRLVQNHFVSKESEIAQQHLLATIVATGNWLKTWMTCTLVFTNAPTPCKNGVISGACGSPSVEPPVFTTGESVLTPHTPCKQNFWNQLHHEAFPLFQPGNSCTWSHPQMNLVWKFTRVQGSFGNQLGIVSFN